jgi:phosphoglycerate kinase
VSTAVGAGVGPPSPGWLPRLEDLPDVDGRGVLVRVDFNVPLDEASGRRTVADDFRIRRALPTLRALLERGAHVTACSHLGRPPDAPDPRWDMAPVRERLHDLLPGVGLLENLRFSPGEKRNDPAFVDQLVAGRDAYVNEAFSASHRAHASIVGPPARLPSAAGLELAHEVEVLGGLLAAPARPFVAVVGGAKVSDKLGVLGVMARKVDVLAVGGAMAFTFLAAQGHAVGDSIVDREHLGACAALLDAGSGVRILLPTDTVALGPDGDVQVVGADIPEGWRGLDVGPDTARAFSDQVATAATVLWNGPLGVVEDERFASGTAEVARAVAACPGFTVVGGGDSVSALRHLGVAESVDFLSTGGGASLEFLERGDLPGLAALRAAPNAPAPQQGFV